MVQKERYGYLMNIAGVIYYALVNLPSIAPLMMTHPFDEWQRTMFRVVVSDIGTKADIPDLSYQGIWIGGGRIGYCWDLPRRFRESNLDDADVKRLERLQALIGLYEPMYFAPHYQPEPEHLKNLPRQEGSGRLCVDEVARAFRLDRKGMIDRLLAGEGTRSIIED